MGTSPLIRTRLWCQEEALQHSQRQTFQCQRCISPCLRIGRLRVTHIPANLMLESQESHRRLHLYRHRYSPHHLLPPPIILSNADIYALPLLIFDYPSHRLTMDWSRTPPLPFHPHTRCQRPSSASHHSPAWSLLYQQSRIEPGPLIHLRSPWKHSFAR